MQILSPPDWPRPKGYVNGIATRGRLVFIAGQVGWDSAERFQSDDFADQAGQALANILTVLAEAGGRAEHLVRLTWFVVDTGDYVASRDRLGAVYRQIIGAHYPAMSVIGVNALFEEGAKLEIEATAVIPD